MTLARRSFECDLSFRSEEKESRTVAGRAAPYGKSASIGWFTEEIRQGAFAESIAQRDVLALVGHDSGRPVATTKRGSLRLTEKEDGLYLSMDPVNTTEGNDLITNVREGLISHLSVGMIIRNYEKEKRDGKPHYTITRAELWEVSAVVWPAYKETSLESQRDAFAAYQGERKRERAHLRRQCTIDEDELLWLQLTCS